MYVNPRALRRAVLAFLVVPCLFTGCEIIPGDGSDPSAFRIDATVAGMRWQGETGSSVNAEGTLFVWGKRGDIDGGNYKSILLEILNFDGVGDYQIGERRASYEEVFGGDQVFLYGHAAATPEDRVIITRYDVSAKVVEGAFLFEATALNPFDDVAEGDVFEVSGTFEAQVQEL